MEEIDPQHFELLFVMDIDSWFSADIKCCNFCYDDFVASWPNTKLRSDDFRSMELDAFYDGSKRLRHEYSLEEFRDLLAYIACPRCGRSLQNNLMWPFEFEFDPPEDFEYRAYELQEKIKETPFIVLKNELAQEAYYAIEKLSELIEERKLETTLFRGRTFKDSQPVKKDFLSPPPNVTNDGRYNHKGIPVIYAANNAKTCFYELRKSENLWVSEFQIKNKLRILDLNKIDEIEADEHLLQAIVWSSLSSSFANDNSWYKPEYFFTRFISDCCKHIGLDGICYPSVQIGTGENYVFFDTTLLSEETITSFYKFE